MKALFQLLAVWLLAPFAFSSIFEGDFFEMGQKSSYVKDEAYVVEFVGILLRHGSRSPKSYYFTQTQWGTCDMGNLIPQGMRQHNVLGQLIRKRYTPSPLPTNPTPDMVHCFADFYQRTHLSAFSFMLGLYPEYTGETIAPNIEFTSVPPNPDPQVKSIVENMRLPNSSVLPALLYNFGIYDIQSFPTKNIMFEPNSGSTCPTYKSLLKKVTKTTEYQTAQNYFNTTFWQPTVDIVNAQVSHFQLTHQEMSFDVAVDILDVYATTRFAGLSPNLELPDDIVAGLEQSSQYVFYNYDFGSFPLINASVTVILSNIRLKMASVVNETRNAPTFVVYSGHGHNFISYFQVFLGVGEGAKLSSPMPPFASNLVFELLKSKSDGHYYVRVLYNDLILRIRTCSMEPCPLDEFEQLVEDTVIPDFENWCNQSQED